MDLPPNIVTFGNWKSIVECANQEKPVLPAPPEVGQDTDTFLHNYGASRSWENKVREIQVCQVALSAWMAGWEAGHAGRPKDPTAK